MNKKPIDLVTVPPIPDISSKWIKQSTKTLQEAGKKARLKVSQQNKEFGIKYDR